MSDNDIIKKLTKDLLRQIGEDPSCEGLLKRLQGLLRLGSSFQGVCKQDIEEIINGAIFNEDAKDMVIVRDVSFFHCVNITFTFFWKGPCRLYTKWKSYWSIQDSDHRYVFKEAASSGTFDSPDSRCY